MKVESDIVLTCSVCRAEGPHKLLYLSQRLRASEYMNCGSTKIYSGHIYAEIRQGSNRAGRLAAVQAGRRSRQEPDGDASVARQSLSRALRTREGDELGSGL
jgi:hypothetical protein